MKYGSRQSTRMHVPCFSKLGNNRCYTWLQRSVDIASIYAVTAKGFVNSPFVLWKRSWKLLAASHQVPFHNDTQIMLYSQTRNYHVQAWLIESLSNMTRGNHQPQTLMTMRVGIDDYAGKWSSTSARSTLSVNGSPKIVKETMVVHQSSSGELVRLETNVSRIIDLSGPQCWALMRDWSSPTWFCGGQVAGLTKTSCVVRFVDLNSGFGLSSTSKAEHRTSRRQTE